MLDVIEAVRRPGEVVSQQSLAALLGTSRQTIARIERRALAKLREAARVRYGETSPWT